MRPLSEMIENLLAVQHETEIRPALVSTPVQEDEDR
jgi:hypothetical protein